MGAGFEQPSKLGRWRKTSLTALHFLGGDTLSRVPRSSWVAGYLFSNHDSFHDGAAATFDPVDE